MPGQFIVGAVHSSAALEVPAHQKDLHRAGLQAALYKTPERNQYCKPTWLVKGVYPKISATVTRFTAAMAEVEKRRAGERAIRSILIPLKVFEPTASK